MYSCLTRAVSVSVVNILKHHQGFRLIQGTTVIGISLFASSASSSQNKSNKKEDDINGDLSYLWTDQNIASFMAKPITNQDLLKKDNHLMRHRMELFILGIQRDVFVSLKKFEQDAQERHEQHCQILDATEVRHGDHVITKSSKLDNMVVVDRWQRQEGGGGISCLIQNGRVFEKAGVNISVVHGMLPPQAVQQMRARGKQFSHSDSNSNQIPFFAAGVSCVIHPRNPNVPTIHFNYRYFEIPQQHQSDNSEAPHQQEPSMWWFGGGTDLTPYLLDEEDVKHFHRELKKACDKNDATFYQKFKQWCDKYFYIIHRKECRGVGGIFFDDVDYPNQLAAFKFVRDCANAVIPSYLPLVEKNLLKNFTDEDRDWQLLRRGRYTEFNLVYDRGTKFGLATPGARIESILMSLPLYAKFHYPHNQKPNPDHEKLTQILKTPKEWIESN